jgi:hypothetical protein
MAASSSRRRLRAAVLAGSLVASLGLVEVVVRVRGHAPARTSGQVIVSVEPGPRLLEPDPLLGWRNAPGAHLVTYASGYQYATSHTHSGTRITRDPLQEHRYRGRPRLEIHGCSFAYGWSVADADTFPWHVQEALPGRDVVNFGVGGHGTVQTWLRLRESLGRGAAPALVVVTYGSLHDERNVLTRRFRKAVVPYSETTAGLQAPRARWSDGQLLVSREALSYERPPLATHSALVELLDEGYCRWQRAGLEERGVTRALLLDIAARCQAVQVPLVIAGIGHDEATRSMLRELASAGVRTVDVSVDLALPENSLLPVDWHPSPAAQAAYARKLLAYLQAEGLG